MKLFSYSSCSTCRRAIKWLENNDIPFELIDILGIPPTKAMLVSASEVYGGRKYLLNTSGLIYRTIGSEVVKKMSDKEFFEKLFIEPRLIKRPFLYKSNKCLLVGFKEEKWAEKLL
ncbi:Spx/MgsR family RNA polymerase-binding regulatory protein [Prochlorococcus marinus]|uniref:ArsC family transcriptional regulator n=1 Tax=Prochlorococcus marinus XMU1408 TaxID=2213228 RepID=A0A318QZ76_PROMR|nr:Spx/MgsR family RNA polymerase-binding regulatory protein [Prochlorococcus marinus]MBW3041539.1 ArsC family transcriptional regulator [Prochlorococcus marinus str. XMU1408]PYE02697.1 ArsC family transcriptional regulator [Prochlorococcus marinus XMU1408]